MFCHKCGAKITNGAAFCHKCGTEVIYETGKPDAPNRSQATAEPDKQESPSSSVKSGTSNHYSESNSDVAQNPARKLSAKIVVVIVFALLAFIALLGGGIMIFGVNVKGKNDSLDSTTPGIFNDALPTHSVPTTQRSDPSIVVERETAQWAYAQKVRELAAENEDLLFDLIDLTENDVPELVADYSGYYIQVFSWTDGEVVSLGDEYWPYGLTGNLGYSYLPGQSVIYNSYSEDAGTIQYEVYSKLNSANELVELPMERLSVWYFRDTNGNGVMDENEPFSEEPIYYVGNTEVSPDVYASYQVTGDFELISGTKTMEMMLTQLNIELESERAEPKELLFNGIAVYDLLGMSVNPIMEEWGTPLEFTEGGGVNYCTYGGITLSFDYQRVIYNVEMSPNMCQFGNAALDKDRLGLIGVLGTPTSEGWETDSEDNEIYRMWYDGFNGGGSLRVELATPDGPAYRIFIW